MIKKLDNNHYNYCLVLFIFFILFLTSNKSFGLDLKDAKLKTKIYDHFNSIIEIPSGTIDKLEYDYKKGQILDVWEKGNRKIINYLGYPTNFGFLPKTQSDDGGLLDVLAIGEKISSGTLVKVKVIGGISFLEDGFTDYKVIAILAPDNDYSKYNSIADKEYFNQLYYKVDRISDIQKNYKGILDILRIWFENYKGEEKIQFKKYLNKNETINLIKSANSKFLKNHE
jgi:inorganic pyrophosphatase